MSSLIRNTDQAHDKGALHYIPSDLVLSMYSSQVPSPARFNGFQKSPWWDITNYGFLSPLTAYSLHGGKPSKASKKLKSPIL